MRTVLLLALLAVPALLLAPAADARSVCSRVLDGPSCPGYACDWRPQGYWYCEDDLLREICLRCWRLP